jgi:hypothetical protein
MIIDDVYTYLDAQLTTLTGGVNLFKSRQSDNPANQTVIYNTGGLEPDRYLPTADPTFQIIVRNTDYSAGEALVASIVGKLHQKENLRLVVTTGIYFYYIMLLNEPSHIGRNEKGQHEWSINFVCRTRR